MQRWLSFWKVLPPLQRNSGALSEWLAGRPALGRALVVPNFIHLRMMEATVFLETFNAPEMCCYPSPDLCLDTILSRSSTDNSYDFHGLVFTLTYNVNYGTLYRQVCTFQNHVQSIEFTTVGLQLRMINGISRIINGNRMHMSSISSLIAKGLNSYVNMVSFFYKCAQISKNLFSICHYGILRVNWGHFFLLNPF